MTLWTSSKIYEESKTTESVIAEAGDLDNAQNAEEDGATIYSSHEHPIIGIPITICPINYGKNQIIISLVNFSPAQPSVIKLFKTKQEFLHKFLKIT